MSPRTVTTAPRTQRLDRSATRRAPRWPRRRARPGHAGLRGRGAAAALTARPLARPGRAHAGVVGPGRADGQPGTGGDDARGARRRAPRRASRALPARAWRWTGASRPRSPTRRPWGTPTRSSPFRATWATRPRPQVRVERRRDVDPDWCASSYTVSSTAAEPVVCTLGLRMAADLAPMDAVKGGTGQRPHARGRRRARAPGWRRTCARCCGSRGRAPPTRATTWPTWEVVDLLGGRSPTSSCSPSTQPRRLRAPSKEPAGSVTVASADGGLLVLDAASTTCGCWAGSARGGRVDEESIGAGAPWFLTLFGRDSLWTDGCRRP